MAEPDNPVAEPDNPVAEPDNLAVRCGDPAEEPDNPVAAPDNPVAEPDNLAEGCGDPAEEPDNPVVGYDDLALWYQHPNLPQHQESCQVLERGSPVLERRYQASEATHYPAMDCCSLVVVLVGSPAVTYCSPALEVAQRQEMVAEDPAQEATRDLVLESCTLDLRLHPKP